MLIDEVLIVDHSPMMQLTCACMALVCAGSQQSYHSLLNVLILTQPLTFLELGSMADSTPQTVQEYSVYQA